MPNDVDVQMAEKQGKLGKFRKALQFAFDDWAKASPELLAVVVSRFKSRAWALQNMVDETEGLPAYRDYEHATLAESGMKAIMAKVTPMALTVLARMSQIQDRVTPALAEHDGKGRPAKERLPA